MRRMIQPPEAEHFEGQYAAAGDATLVLRIGEIVLRLRNILERSRLANENRLLRHSLNRYEEFDEIIGVSEAVARLKQQIKEIAPSDVAVLIQGPTGVGKELVARALHAQNAIFLDDRDRRVEPLHQLAFWAGDGDGRAVDLDLDATRQLYWGTADPGHLKAPRTTRRTGEARRPDPSARRRAR